MLNFQQSFDQNRAYENQHLVEPAGHRNAAFFSLS